MFQNFEQLLEVDRLHIKLRDQATIYLDYSKGQIASEEEYK